MSKGEPARFITLEGGEGAGKSTQAGRLSAALDRCGIANIVTREPGGSPGAEDIRKLLVEGEPGRWDALTETVLLYAARADHIVHTIKPALTAGKWVICDRFSDSTFAYQGAGRGIDRETIRRIDSIVVGDLKPDVTIILDFPVEAGLARAKARGGNEARFENFDTEFHKRLRNAFRDIARKYPARCVLLDAQGSEDEVAAAIWNTICERFRI